MVFQLWVASACVCFRALFDSCASPPHPPLPPSASREWMNSPSRTTHKCTRLIRWLRFICMWVPFLVFIIKNGTFYVKLFHKLECLKCLYGLRCCSQLRQLTSLVSCLLHLWYSYLIVFHMLVSYLHRAAACYNERIF